MARRYVRALDEKVKRVKEHVEMGTATEEEVAWLTRIDATIALYGSHIQIGVKLQGGSER